MKLYARRTSSNCQKVLWFLGELGIDYEFIATGGDAGGLDTPGYRALNPNVRVPTWQDDQGPVWESHSTLRYLAAIHGPDVWWSEDPAERSRVERWMDWSQSGFDPAFMNLFWGYWRTPVEDRDEKLVREQVERCRSALLILDDVLSASRFIAGDRLTLADIPIGALMYRYANLDVTEELPRSVARWYERLTEREPYRTHVMLPFDELKGRLAY
ncbi:MAG: glutathione S-transferase family protein [Pseudomonadales bacterium]